MSEQDFTRKDLNERTMQFSVRIISMVKSMPKGIVENNIANQLVRSATSIGANYREASHAKSSNDFSAKLKICEGEAAESLYWLQLIINANLLPKQKMYSLEQEAKELVSIFTVAAKHAYHNRKH